MVDSTTSVRSAGSSVSAIVCAYTEDRYGPLTEAIQSLLAQSSPPLEIILVIDHNERLLERVQAAFPDVRTIPNEGDRGDSASRTTGARHAGGEIVAFLDDDARADPGWVAAIARSYADPHVIGTGGPVRPRWATARPVWMPEEFYWVIGCSYRGLPTTRQPIRNPLGTNMSFRRSVLEEEGWFSQEITSVGTSTRGCQETEFAIRASARRPGSRILFIPEAGADHLVESRRTSLRFFGSRCWGEGRSKALVSSAVGPTAALASERAYATRVLPLGVARGLLDAVRGDLGGLGRAGAIIAGLAITAAAYLYGRATELLGT